MICFGLELITIRTSPLVYQTSDLKEMLSCFVSPHIQLALIYIKALNPGI